MGPATAAVALLGLAGGPASSSPTTRACQRRHGYRRFLNRQQRAHHLPALLWTFPGAGNTWLRMLLDYSTGVYSGSIYGDPSLLPLLPGEGRCDRSVVAVKAHPQHIDSFDFVPAHGGVLRLNSSRKPQYTKCAPLRFRGAIVVVRDPYRAIWAEYKRYVNWKEVVAGRPASVGESSAACRLALRAQSLHGGALLRACFDAAHFRQHATHLARAWKHSWFHYGRFRSMRHAQLLTVAYEDLTHPQRRAAVLRRMVDFVGQPTRPAPARASDDALACAFRLAESPHIHRDRQAERGSEVASIGDAYANRTLVCQMWALFRRRAAKSGYAPFGGVQC